MKAPAPEGVERLVVALYALGVCHTPWRTAAYEATPSGRRRIGSRLASPAGATDTGLASRQQVEQRQAGGLLPVLFVLQPILALIDRCSHGWNRTTHAWPSQRR
jgi:hypothetical protein